jgi:hypothetical protein
MMKKSDTPRRVPRGRPIDWADADLDALAEIHVTEDTPLMLAFVRQHGTRLLADVLDAQPQPEEDDGNTPNSAAA